SAEASADEPDHQPESDASDPNATDAQGTPQEPKPAKKKAEDVDDKGTAPDEKDAAEAEPAAAPDQDSENQQADDVDDEAIPSGETDAAEAEPAADPNPDQNSERSSADASRNNES